MKKLTELITGGVPAIYASGIKGSAAAFLLSLLFAKVNRNILVVSSSHQETKEFYYELTFFMGQDGLAKPANVQDIVVLPPFETLPYENLSTHPDVSGQRIWALHKLCTATRPCIVLTCMQALLQKIVPHEILLGACHKVRLGEELDRDRLCSSLIKSGYTRVSLVEDRGDLSVRGEVIDVFSPGYPQPLRIDFFGDAVESIRLFDPLTQRSSEQKHAVTILPVKEAILTEEVITACQKMALQAAHKKNFAESKGKMFLEQIQNGFFPAGIEYMLSFIYPRLETVFDYLASDCLVLWQNMAAIEKDGAAFLQEVDQYYLAALDEKRLVSPPDELFIARDDLETFKRKTQSVFVEGWEAEKPGDCQAVFALQSNEDIRKEMIHLDSSKGALLSLADRMAQWFDEGCQIFLICHTAGQSERLKELFHDYGIRAKISRAALTQGYTPETQPGLLEIKIGRLARGFRYPAGKLIVITEEEIFGAKKRRPIAPRFKEGIAVTSFTDLKEKDFIVHRDHGIGIYGGLQTLEAGGIKGEYLALQYLGGDKLYLPIANINLVQKYEGSEGSIARLDRLGGNSWGRVKQKVKEAIQKMAKDLVELYSARKVYLGHTFSPLDHYYREFEATFPFEETPDQLAAIEDVMQDMSNSMPMDRLVCGDVGYGKTEVAIRAAFRAVMDGKQVAILVPTTVLAQQHYLTFVERFSPYPVYIEILSRFRSAKEQKKVLEQTASGQVDIVIGTHRLIQKDVVFKELGLLVIDEEHRFGVRHKEQLKKLRKTVDVITLTATPIPRTLQLSFAGIRDLSIINTPPEDRLSIRTVITHFDEDIIRDAVLQELRRGGQIFFVHDRVRSIAAMALFLKRLVPEIRLGIAHGQMKEKELEESMVKFIKREVDLLLCTTIIESGLDFPAANTIIINRADKLGLAQMYQLRGRVGRGKYRAYAYLLVPGDSILSTDAKKRLEALSEFTELGSGYRLAARDLQIRGAGNLLGHSQSGQIAAVGLEMYLQLLDESIHELKGEKLPPQIEPAVNLSIQAYIPEQYIPDINQRLVIYKRLSTMLQEDDIIDLERELIDRFGTLPVQVENLFEIGRLKSLLRRYLILSVDYNRKDLIFTFHEEAEGSLEKILSLVSHDKERFRFTPDHRLFVRYQGEGGRELITEIKSILQ